MASAAVRPMYVRLYYDCDRASCGDHNAGIQIFQHVNYVPYNYSISVHRNEKATYDGRCFRNDRKPSVVIGTVSAQLKKLPVSILGEFFDSFESSSRTASTFVATRRGNSVSRILA